MIRKGNVFLITHDDFCLFLGQSVEPSKSLEPFFEYTQTPLLTLHRFDSSKHTADSCNTP